MPEFLFGAPLYTEYKVGEAFVALLYARRRDNKIDGYCIYCKKQTTFTMKGMSIPNGDPWDSISERVSYDDCHIVCAREETHKIRYWFLFRKMHVQKVGQYPSLADISNDEVAPYRSGLRRQDAQEFHKAIGLNAHGVGVGAFVYLRRVFERLVYNRYEEFKEAESWADSSFYPLPMADKVKFLKGHLPEFLVENSKIYSILSVGIHELDEDECLKSFDVMKNSIVMILEDDKKKKEELALRAKFRKAIADFGVDPAGQPGEAGGDKTSETVTDASRE